MLADSIAVVAHSWDLGQKRNGTEPTLTNQDGAWDKTAEQMMLNFAGTSHPIFRASSALERGEIRSKAKVRSPFTSTAAKKKSNCFSAQ